MDRDFGPAATRRRKLILGGAVIVAVLAFLGLVLAGFGSPTYQLAEAGDAEPVSGQTYWFVGVGTLVVIGISLFFHWLVDRRSD